MPQSANTRNAIFGAIPDPTAAKELADVAGGAQPYNQTIAGTLAVTGAATLSSTLAVTGASTLSSTLGVTGVTTPTGGVAAAGGFSATPAGLLNTQGYVPIVSTYGTDTTPTTTSVYVCEIFVPCNMTIVGVTFMNGTATGNGTVTIGLYTAAGVAIAAALTAATTTTGNDAYQKVAFATPYAALGPAKYLIGFQWSSASDKFNVHPFGSAFYSLAQASATIGVTAISPLPTAFVTGSSVVASLY